MIFYHNSRNPKKIVNGKLMKISMAFFKETEKKFKDLYGITKDCKAKVILGKRKELEKAYYLMSKCTTKLEKSQEHDTAINRDIQVSATQLLETIGTNPLIYR